VRKIRIFHLIKSLNRGGAETLLAEGLRFADREQFELSYGFFNPGLCALAPTLVAGGARVTCFGGDNHVTMLARTGRVARHLREQRIDLLHCHLPMAGVVGRMAARMAGVPMVYTEHNKPEWYRKPTFWLNAWTYALQQQVIAVSDSVEDSIRTYIRPDVPLLVVRNGIDASAFCRAAGDGDALRQRLNIPQNAPVIGNVAALIPQKRLHDWIDAARQVHARKADTRFLIVGEGPQYGALSQRIAAYGLQDVVHLCGGQSDVRPHLAAMDIYMMSSAYEGLPVALLEAMAMQCVPVCTAVGGIPEVIRDRANGYLTEPSRPDQLAERVLALLENPVLLRTIATAARLTIESDFRLDRMVRTVESVYLRVLDRRSEGWPSGNGRLSNAGDSLAKRHELSVPLPEQARSTSAVTVRENSMRHL
jgi:glycosyltransferase involved in cell wall biosynthesis